MIEQEIKRLKERLEIIEQLLCQNFDEKIIRAQRFGYDSELIVQEYENLIREKAQINMALQPYYAKQKQLKDEKEKFAFERNESAKNTLRNNYNTLSVEKLVNRWNTIYQVKNNPNFRYVSLDKKCIIDEITYTFKEVSDEYYILKNYIADWSSKHIEEINLRKESLRNKYREWTLEELQLNINSISKLLEGRHSCEIVFFRDILFRIDELRSEHSKMEEVYKVRYKIFRQQKEQEELQKCIRIEPNQFSLIPNNFHAVITDYTKYNELYRRNPEMVNNYIRSQIEWERRREEEEKYEKIKREEKIKAERTAYFKEIEKTKNIGATLKYIRDAYGNIIGVIPVNSN